jgi:hypothetical protein
MWAISVNYACARSRLGTFCNIKRKS